MKINLKTITLVKGLESVTINRHFTINHELGYTHYGIFLGAKFQGIINDMLGKQLPMTNKYKRYLWEVAQWAQLGALFRVSLPNLKSNFIYRYIGGVEYGINLTYNYIMLRDMSNDTYLYVSLDSNTTYALYAYHYEKQLQSLDEAILNLAFKPSLKDKLFTWIKNVLN